MLGEKKENVFFYPLMTLLAEEKDVSILRIVVEVNQHLTLEMNR